MTNAGTPEPTITDPSKQQRSSDKDVTEMHAVGGLVACSEEVSAATVSRQGDANVRTQA